MSNNDDNKGDWDFRVTDLEEQAKKEKGPQKVASDTGIRRLMKKGKDPKLDLAFDKIPKKISRSDAEAMINKDHHTTGQKDTSTPIIGIRMTSAIIDIVFVAVLYLVAKGGLFMNFSFNQLDKLYGVIGMGELPENNSTDAILLAGNFFILYFFVFVIPAAFFSKTPGKFFNKIIIDDIDGGEIGFVRTFFREVICKPISAISLFGLLMVFMNPKRRCLHDFLSKSIVRKDY